jgi:ABC-type sugar transport system substrate-binding protein
METVTPEEPVHAGEGASMTNSPETPSRPTGRRRLRFAAGALSLALVMGLAACGGSDTTETTVGSDDGATTTSEAMATTTSTSADTGDGMKGTIAFGQPHRAGDFYAALLAGAKQEAEERGYELLESFAEGEVENQINEINTWIAQGVDGMTVLALDPSAMQPLVDSAHEAGAVWVAYAAGMPGTDGAVLFDDEQGARIVGEEAARWINEELGGTAKVVLLGDDTIETPRLRLDGALAAIEELAPGAEIVARQDGLLAPEALTAMQSLLQADPEIDVVICAADDGALGVSQAYANSGLDTSKVFVAGWDGSKAAMQKVLDGDVIRAVGALDLNLIGRAVVFVPANILEGNDDEPTEFAAPYVLVTPDNVDEAQRLIDAFPSS